MNREYNYKGVTAFYIDIRKYTELALLKEPEIVIDFIHDYRKIVDKEFKSITKNTFKIIDTLYIGDAILIIIDTTDGDEIDILRTTVKTSLKIRKEMLKLLDIWGDKNDRAGRKLTFFKKEVNFGIGISQGKIYINKNDYIGTPLNHAAKIGDINKLSQNGHIGIDKEVFDKISVLNQFSFSQLEDKKIIGSTHTKKIKYVAYMPFEKEFGSPW